MVKPLGILIILIKCSQYDNNYGIIDSMISNENGIHVRLDDDNDNMLIISLPESAHKYGLDLIPTYMPLASTADEPYKCRLKATPITSMSITQQLYKARHEMNTKVVFDKPASSLIVSNINQLPKPTMYVKNGGVYVMMPHTPMWDDVCRKAGATLRNDGSRKIPPARLRDFAALNEMLPEPFRAKMDKQVYDMLHAPIPAPYDGSDESLRHVSLDALEYIHQDSQPWSMRKKKDKPMSEKLQAMGYNNLHDLIVRPPIRYIDRSQSMQIGDLIEGEHATIECKVIAITQKTDKLWLLTVEDTSGTTMDCSFFNGSFLQHVYQPGDKVIIDGVYKPYHGWNGIQPQMDHPMIDFADIDTMPVIPIYRQSGKNGVNSLMIMNCERELVDRLGDYHGARWIEDAYMNADLKDNDGNEIPTSNRMPYGKALKTMHAPATMDELNKAHDSLAFSELVQLMVIIEDSRRGLKPTMGISMKPTGVLTKAYMDCLKYNLTGAQSRTLKDIDARLRAKTPMHALLVGDVGSGKTTVIHMAALKAVESGYQAVICAPTEILATQLYDVFMGILDKMPLSARSMIHPILHAKYKGKGSTQRKRDNVKAIADGTANIVFGTHAVFSDKLKWHNLGFVGIDEQHKFGAEQRTKLLGIRDDGRQPDMLMQTATPIPRSIAQMYYGDIAYMRLDELPAGRLPIKTEWVKMKGQQLLDDADNDIWCDVMNEASDGHGTFVICPMVEDNPRQAAASVKTAYERVKSILGLTAKVGLVYGSQDAQEQAQMIDDFRTGKIQVLVASSVVEVGVSCEKATRMIILDANRFGLASLHQIRGRIGRGNLPSVCWLVSMAFTTDAQNRMQAMTETLDGWKLSQKDLRNRGSGTVFGDSQSGGSDFLFADLVDNGKWIGEARRIALEELKSDNASEALRDSMNWFGLKDGDTILS